MQFLTVYLHPIVGDSRLNSHSLEHPVFQAIRPPQQSYYYYLLVKFRVIGSNDVFVCFSFLLFLLPQIDRPIILQLLVLFL
jgi:hypothetical protein